MLMLSFASSFVAQDAEYKPPRKWTFGSMGIAMRDDLTVYQGGARDADGNIVIQEKDQLLKWNGKELKTLDDFCRNLYATKPGEIVDVEIASPGDGEKRLVHTVKIKLGDPKQAFKELYTQLDKRERGYDWRKSEAVTKGGPLREKLWPMVEKHKLTGEWDNLLAAHEREIDLWDSYENLSSTDLLLSDPLSAHQWITEVGRKLEQAADPYETIEQLSALLDREVPSASNWPEAGLEDMRLALNPLDWSNSWSSAPADRIEVNPEIIRDFEFSWRGTPGFERSAESVVRMREFDGAWLKVLPRIRSAMNQLTAGLQKRFDEHDWAADSPSEEGGLGQAPKWRGQKGKGPDEDGACILWKTGYGLVAIGGPGRNVWTASDRAHYAIILDIGGDDEYVDCGTTSLNIQGELTWNGSNRVALIIDLAGNDHYRSTGKWGVACGMLGTAIIDDHEGNDTYECGDWGIGAAFGGVGLLIDRKGNDRYLGGNNSIGCAAYGVGGVIDLEGNDLYDSHTLSVGVGQPGGVGFVLDHSGDDRYRCTGGEPSSYGTKGEWFGGGIGCGFGWRTLACGGIGLVVDVKGNDIYDAGEFGLGCGYFMAIGAVRDMEGDDIYHSSRYGLAAAAHAAVGVFMDDKGNDVYEGKTAASIGGTWDIVTGYFYDGGGDDNYRCDGLGLGACAQNGFGIFWDAGGADNYRGGKTTIGNAGNAEYGGGRLAKNFGIFMDTGGGKDNYPRDDRKNENEIVEQQFALFLDD
ncbi:MAG: hypothetical protein H6840_01865 [Planctomycetes bacterium]|nr:hypothetical protein [Planctomycetota bacterium]